MPRKIKGPLSSRAYLAKISRFKSTSVVDEPLPSLPQQSVRVNHRLTAQGTFDRTKYSKTVKTLIQQIVEGFNRQQESLPIDEFPYSISFELDMLGVNSDISSDYRMVVDIRAAPLIPDPTCPVDFYATYRLKRELAYIEGPAFKDRLTNISGAGFDNDEFGSATLGQTYLLSLVASSTQDYTLALRTSQANALRYILCFAVEYNSLLYVALSSSVCIYPNSADITVVSYATFYPRLKLGQHAVIPKMVPTMSKDEKGFKFLEKVLPKATLSRKALIDMLKGEF